MSSIDCQIALENPKGTDNVGAVLRAAGCFAASHVYYSGVRYDRAAKFADAAAKHLGKVELSKTDVLLGCCPEGYAKVAVELALGATPLTEFEHPAKAIYLFGPEDGSLDQSTIDACDHVVYIPATNSLNLAASVNVLLYDRMQKMAALTPSDNLVLQSRDNRNRLSVSSRVSGHASDHVSGRVTD